MEIGTLRHLVTLEAPGTAVADGDGGYTQVYTALTPPKVWASIEPATARDLERVAAGTVISTATHVIRCRYHAGIDTQTRIRFNDRTFSVTGVQNIEERNRELEIVAVEIVQ